MLGQNSIINFDNLISPEAAMDEFAIRRFYDDKLAGVTQPSQRRYSYDYHSILKYLITFDNLDCT